ncbi:hypothetical protein BDN71DRAFT_1437253 [Pleurotus eryngii]|uniref:Uncharacterized protein n=1 Tax=Pleurotus eryngii TaxID=5323 RepID=A0A9P5ZHU0_PLEER|nr:hypothetical protein BDN71DRAFT_1437253 [Pleurotus eryngii]
MSTRTVSCVLSDYRKHETITRPPMRLELRGAKHCLSMDDLQFIKGMITFKPDIYLDELRQALAEQRGTVIATKTLARGLAQMNYTCKQITKAAAECNQLKRAAYLYEYGIHFTSEQTVFVDKSSLNTLTNTQKLDNHVEMVGDPVCTMYWVGYLVGKGWRVGVQGPTFMLIQV